MKKLTDKQRSVLLALTNDWQTPTKIAARLPKSLEEKDWAPLYGSSYVNQPLKALLREGLAEMNPEKRGQYRLTEMGLAVKSEVEKEHAN